METINIKWLIAHEPVSLFVRAAQSFSQQVNKQLEPLNKKLDIEILTALEYGKKYNNGKPVTIYDVLDLMNQGHVQMSQTHTTMLASKFSKDMHVLDLPFLFDSHEHATQVLEGEVGEYLLSSVGKNSNVEALGFTYSGGWRCVPSKAVISSLDDFKDLAMRTGTNVYAQETFRLLGANVVPMSLEEVTSAALTGKIDAGESAYPRIYPLEQNTFSRAFIDTKHSMFLTSIIIAKDFWNNLDEDIRAGMKAAAIEAAREERQASIDDAEAAKIRGLSEGIKVVELSDHDQKKFKELSQQVYEKFADHFSPGLVDSIRIH